MSPLCSPAWSFSGQQRTARRSQGGSLQCKPGRPGVRARGVERSLASVWAKRDCQDPGQRDRLHAGGAGIPSGLQGARPGLRWSRKRGDRKCGDRKCEARGSRGRTAVRAGLGAGGRGPWGLGGPTGRTVAPNPLAELAPEAKKGTRAREAGPPRWSRAPSGFGAVPVASEAQDKRTYNSWCGEKVRFAVLNLKSKAVSVGPDSLHLRQKDGRLKFCG